MDIENNLRLSRKLIQKAVASHWKFQILMVIQFSCHILSTTCHFSHKVEAKIYVHKSIKIMKRNKSVNTNKMRLVS